MTDASAERVEDKYVTRSGTDVEVWNEANGLDGLQTQACEDADGTTHDADDHQTTAGMATCYDAEGQATSSPAGAAYGPLPGTACELVDNWAGYSVETGSDAASGGALPMSTADTTDVFAACNDLVSDVPPRGLQCA